MFPSSAAKVEKYTPTCHTQLNRGLTIFLPDDNTKSSIQKVFCSKKLNKSQIENLSNSNHTSVCYKYFNTGFSFWHLDNIYYVTPAQ